MRRRYGVKAACLVLCLSLLSGAGAVHAASIADRIDAAKEDLYDGLVKACQQYRGDAAGADRCTRAVLLTAFDDIGAARRRLP
jgi:hypothetical protein